MKIVLLTDTHFGCREGRELFHTHFENFYRDVFFPYLDKHEITQVIHLGDLFDKRKSIDFLSLKRAREYFFNPLAEREVKMSVLIGNHDIFLRNSLEINSPELLLYDYPNITPIKVPVEEQYGSLNVLLVPWICSENSEQVFGKIKKSNADICMGHFEIEGFAMYKGLESHEGIAPSTFKRFDKTFSGHYHHRSTQGNISYLGSPYEMNHMDWNDPRGFHVLDTETKDVEFVKNPFNLFERIEYDEDEDPKADQKQLKNKFVRVVVTNKKDLYKFDQFMERVLTSGSYDVKVFESVSDMKAEDMKDELNIEDTQTIIKHFVDSSEVEVEKEKLSKYMTSLYVEAINQDL